MAEKHDDRSNIEKVARGLGRVTGMAKKKLAAWWAEIDAEEDSEEEAEDPGEDGAREESRAPVQPPSE